MKVASEFFAISDRRSRQHQTSTFRQKKSDGFGIHFVFKSLLTTPSNVLPLHLKQTFQLIIWIFTEVEGGGIKTRLPIKIFSTLATKRKADDNEEDAEDLGGPSEKKAAKIDPINIDNNCGMQL